MKSSLYLMLLLGLVANLSCGCKLPPAKQREREALRQWEQLMDDTSTDIDEAVGALLAGLEGADRIEILQGLPREIWDGSEFAPGQKPKACREIAGQWFYGKPQAVKVSDMPELRRLLKGGVIQRWGGIKLCCRFHADYALVVTKGNSTFYLLSCFGCGEAKLIRKTQSVWGGPKPRDFRVLGDFEKYELYLQWAKWLDAYKQEQLAAKPMAVTEPEAKDN